MSVCLSRWNGNSPVVQTNKDSLYGISNWRHSGSDIFLGRSPRRFGKPMHEARDESSVPGKHVLHSSKCISINTEEHIELTYLQAMRIKKALQVSDPKKRKRDVGDEDKKVSFTRPRCYVEDADEDEEVEQTDKQLSAMDLEGSRD